MKIETKICLSKRTDIIPCVCLKTGIASGLQMPQIPKGLKGEAFVFEYIHPLSYWSNAQGMIKAGRSYLASLDIEVLAGLALTAFKHYSLLDTYELSAVEANAVLCTASRDTLVDLVCMASLVTDKNAQSAPALTIEWKSVKYSETLDEQLIEYVKMLKADFLIPIKEEDAGQRQIRILNASVGQGRVFKNGVQLLSAKAAMLNHEIEFEAAFKAGRKEAKGLVQEMKSLGGNEKLIGFLDTLLIGRNLIAVDNEIRKRLQERLIGLGTIEATRLASLIGSCQNPYDIFAKADEGLDRASDSFDKPVKVRTLAEILAAKKEGKGHAAPEGRDLEILLSNRVTNSINNPGISSINKPNDSISPVEDEEIEDLLDIVLEEGVEGLTEEDDGLEVSEADGLEDTYSRFTKDLYSSKDF